MQSFLKAVAKPAKLQLRQGVVFMNQHGLKRLPVLDFVLVRQDNHFTVLREIKTRQVVRNTTLGFVRINVTKSTQHCGKIVL